MNNLVYLYLLSPLHTGGTTQEGNLLGIARESHTNFPYIPSSTIRGRLRSSFGGDVEEKIKQVKLFGPDLKDTQSEEFQFFYEAETGKKLTQLEQGSIWIGDGSLLWIPVPSLSHGVVWISCPLLLQRWLRFTTGKSEIAVKDYSTNLPKKSPVYLKDAVLTTGSLNTWEKWQDFIPKSAHNSIKRVIVLPDQHCETLIQMSLWRQVKIKLNENKVVDGGFRYEEAIPPDTLMYFPWGITAQMNSKKPECEQEFNQLLQKYSTLQIGGQESLGRGFVQHWLDTPKSNLVS